MKLQVSPVEGTPSPPSEQLIIPLLGAVSDGHAKKENTLATFSLCIKYQCIIRMSCKYEAAYFYYT